ncbi:unnamed protein product [Chrysoparadoxa australica]
MRGISLLSALAVASCSGCKALSLGGDPVPALRLNHGHAPMRLSEYRQEASMAFGSRTWQRWVSRRRGPVAEGAARGSTRSFVAGVVATGVLSLGARGARAMNMPSASAGTAVLEPLAPSAVAIRFSLWLFLFLLSAAFHAAEIAITTLYPWKVKEIVEEEGEKSPFYILSKDITRVLTTILVTTTIATIYSAALFTNTAIQVIGPKGLALATAVLTATTLFFGELLPKALGVNNAEMVARRLIPIINVLAIFISPIGKGFSTISKVVLSMMGLKTGSGDAVSEEQLRLIIMDAKQSGGIEVQEGSMIEAVLDLQDSKVSEVMRPRVDVVAIESNSTMKDLYRLVNVTKYSRIPVYDGEIDRVMGVCLSKTVLEFINNPHELDTALVKEHMEQTYFVPETMTVWNVLEEMRKRRLHMAIVVDEYGGTAGVVTLEDILEEVVGEIYDEEDDEMMESEHYINLNSDGGYTIHGMADLEDVSTVLQTWKVSEENIREFGTLSGYLCSQAGEIPEEGDFITANNFMFTVTKADERRIEEVEAKLIEEEIEEEEVEVLENIIHE